MSHPRDFAALLAPHRCWDEDVERWYRTPPHVLPDVLLQNRDELVDFLTWVDGQGIRSYLEIGSWTGRLVSLMHALFPLDATAACDLGLAQMCGLPNNLPPGCRFHRGSSHAAPYRVWRAGLGHVDLVMIDGDHTYDGVKRDFDINRRHPHRFLAFHDISGARPGTEGVKRFWDELSGHKVTFSRPHRELGLPHTTMGIGVWWA